MNISILHNCFTGLVDSGRCALDGMLQGRVVVVTGGSMGIGRAIAVGAARHGARAVIIGDIREPAPFETDVTLSGHSPCQHEFIHTDVSKKVDADALLAAADKFGGADLAVCNAGIALPDDGPELAEDRYRRLVNVNLDGVFFTAQAAARKMRAAGRSGSIVLMSSMGGLRGSAATVVYSATKGALVLLAKSLADSLGSHAIRVNAVCPGVIDTGLSRSSPAVQAALPAFAARTPLRRIGRPEEIADAVVWLGSNMSSFVTGAAIVVDGGLSAVL